MRFRSFAVFVVALLLAGGAAWFANRWIQLQVTPVAAEDNPAVLLVVASRTIPMGQKIVDTHLEIVPWPADRVPSDSFTDLEKVKGQVAIQTIYKGEAILKGRIAAHDKGSTLSALIPKNKRAVTLRVNDVVGVAGFVLPGNRVDVMWARGRKGKGGSVETILQNMKVLAVDQSTGGKDQPVVVRAVTLETSPEEAERLFEARSKGSIQLALRNSLDADVIAPPTPKPRARPKPIRQVQYVEIIRGTAVSKQRQ